jgi:hypothetical protein
MTRLTAIFVYFKLQTRLKMYLSDEGLVLAASSIPKLDPLPVFVEQVRNGQSFCHQKSSSLLL